jgi:hypothetical protein
MSITQIRSSLADSLHWQRLRHWSEIAPTPQTATLCMSGKWFVIYWTEEPAGSSWPTIRSSCRKACSWATSGMNCSCQNRARSGSVYVSIPSGVALLINRFRLSKPYVLVPLASVSVARCLCALYEYGRTMADSCLRVGGNRLARLASENAVGRVRSFRGRMAPRGRIRTSNVSVNRFDFNSISRCSTVA